MQSFQSYILKVAPPHYINQYVHCDGLEKVIVQLAEIHRSWKIGRPFPQTAAVSLANQFLEILHAILLRQQVHEPGPCELAIKSIFHEYLNEEIAKVNHFAAYKYEEIQSRIRQECRLLSRIVAYDTGTTDVKKASDMEQSHGSRKNSIQSIDNITIHIHSATDADEFVYKVETPNSDASDTAGFSTASSQALGTTAQQAQIESSKRYEQSLEGKELECTSSEVQDTSMLHMNITRDSSKASNLFTKTLSQSQNCSSSCSFSISEDGETIRDESFHFHRDHYLKECEMNLEAQSAEALHLSFYISTNYKAIVHLANLFDQMIETKITPWIIASLSRVLFTNLDLDRILIYMSVAWAKFRSVQAKDYCNDTKSKWVPPESFVRRTSKYWVPNDQLMRLKLSILRHMPYLIFGSSMEELEAYVDPYVFSQRAVPQKDIAESQVITTVYFDSDDGHCYETRLKRQDGAQLVRFRWYGENANEPHKPIFIERKTHYDRVLGNSSTKERFVIPQVYVSDYITNDMAIGDIVYNQVLAGKLVPFSRQYENSLKLGQEIQSLISEKNLKPFIRTSYRRCAFQLSTSNDVRFSIDTHLCMADEYTVSDKVYQKVEEYGIKQWCRFGEEILGKDEITRFSYAILEVKLQVEEQPEWVTNILNDVEAMYVYKFSKFHHGMAFLHSRIGDMHGFPHWIDFYLYTQSQMDTMHMIEYADRDAIISDSGTENVKSIKAALENFFSFFWRKNKTPDQLKAQQENSMRPINNVLQLQTGNFDQINRLESCFNKSHSQSCANLTLLWASTQKSCEDPVKAIFRRSKHILRIEPKSFFACERTLLHYLDKAVYIATVGTALLTLDTGSLFRKYTGMSLGVLSLFMMFFSYAVFWERNTKIGRRTTNPWHEVDERLDHLHGPYMLVFCLLITIGIAIFSGTMAKKPLQ